MYRYIGVGSGGDPLPPANFCDQVIVHFLYWTKILNENVAPPLPQVKHLPTPMRYGAGTFIGTGFLELCDSVSGVSSCCGVGEGSASVSSG